MTDDTEQQPEPGSTRLEAARAMATYRGIEDVPEEGPLPPAIWDQVKDSVPE